jgi:hypothetical protein
MATNSSTQIGQGADGSSWTSTVDLDTNNGSKTSTVTFSTPKGPVTLTGTPDSVSSQLGALMTQNAAFPKYVSLLAAAQSALLNISSTLTAQYQQQNPPPSTEPIPPGTANNTNSNNLEGTPAGGDNGFDQSAAARLNAINNAESEGTTTSNNEMETLNESFAGKTTAGVANANNAKTTSGTTTTTGAKPGKRTQNPLSNFASYTYQITLYMITPDAYDAFIQTGRRKIDALSNGTEGAFIVAQSGGINNETSRRPPGFKYDYFIDDLKIKSSLNGKESLTASNITSLSFNIYEPYGFSFISNIANAALALKSNAKNFRDLSNASRQFFVLGIRFQGYDKDGKLISGSETTQQNTVTNPQGEPGGIFERFFDIYLTSMKFKIDGKVTVYNITAATVAPRAAFGIKRGTIKTGAQVVAGTIQQALGNEGTDPVGIKSLLGTLNEQERLYVKNAPASSGAIANVYRLEFQGPADVIANSSIVTESDKQNKDLWPMSKAAKTIQVNETISVSSTPDNTKRSISFRNGMSIMQAISSIISQSTYMADALKVIYTSEVEPDQNSNGEDEIVNREPKTFKWYNLGARVKPLGFDKNVGDWAYEITYVIQPYDCPAVISPYAGKTPKYYGPHKRYEYWYTGKNSEIINYEQRLDNAYFNTAVMPSGDDASHGGGQDVPTVAGMRQNEDRTGQKDIGKEAQNSILTSLFSPGDYAKAKVTIMGDPDYLIQDSPATTNAVYSQFYGTDGFTINPNGGQVFIEIDFKEAEDYKVDSGLLTINQSILFWKYPSSINIKGVSYMVNTVTSTMSKGKFTQDLDCVINTFPGATNTATASNRETVATPNLGDVRTGTTEGGTTGTQGSTGQNTTSGSGYVGEDFTGVDEAIARQAQINNLGDFAGVSEAIARNQQLTTPTGNSLNPNVNSDENEFSGSTTAGSVNSGSSSVTEGGRESDTSISGSRDLNTGIGPAGP